MSKAAILPEAVRAVDYKLLQVSSPAFTDGGMIPSKYTCDGIDVSPPLQIGHIPENAVCLALIVDDPDAPGGEWVHWVAWNIPVTSLIRENELHGAEGTNDFKVRDYRGPCPPSGTHRYIFKVYALDALIDLPGRSRKFHLEKAMGGHILAYGELTGIYQRKMGGSKKII